MKKNIDYLSARDLLLGLAGTVETERIPLEESAGRVLAQEVRALENVPAFDRSPYDGYAVRTADCLTASQDAPVTLRILEEIAAGAVPSMPLRAMTAAKILTGAPIPEGADAVVAYERTKFSETEVTIFEALQPGENIVRAGEDVQAGQLLAEAGMCIDAGLAGTLASQEIAEPSVYRLPRVGIISTGSEVVELGEPVPPGKIRNSNRYTLAAALRRAGCAPRYLGQARDCTQEIAALIAAGLDSCDAVLLTGGVSVGDYDLTPAAMELAGVEILVRGVDIKPGMACAYGVKAGKLVCGLSGNPASSVTNLYAVVLPALRRLSGRRDVLLPELTVTLAVDFGKKSRSCRLLRGRLELDDGTVKMHLPQDQGNVVISSAIGCDVIAVVPAGSGALKAGERLKGFLI